jgi:hypothetical protein
VRHAIELQRWIAEMLTRDVTRGPAARAFDPPAIFRRGSEPQKWQRARRKAQARCAAKKMAPNYVWATCDRQNYNERLIVKPKGEKPK